MPSGVSPGVIPPGRHAGVPAAAGDGLWLAVVVPVRKQTTCGPSGGEDCGRCAPGRQGLGWCETPRHVSSPDTLNQCQGWRALLGGLPSPPIAHSTPRWCTACSPCNNMRGHVSFPNNTKPLGLARGVDQAGSEQSRSPSLRAHTVLIEPVEPVEPGKKTSMQPLHRAPQSRNGHGQATTELT